MASPPCVVWWATPVAPEGASGLVDLLDAHERERLSRLRRAADRHRYLAAHALARLVLADAVGHAAASLGFDRTCRCGAQHGRPVLPGGPDFSLTHAGHLVGVAVHADGPVGLDVEQVREVRDLAGMTTHVCSPAELARDPAPGVDAFFAIWTRKEALLKATGDGLARPMTSITLGPTGMPEWTGADPPAGPSWWRDLRPAPGHPAAVAGLGAAPGTVREADGAAVLSRVLASGVR